MAIEGAISARLTRWITAEPDWDAVYADQLPRVYNFFRYRFGDSADAEDLTSRTFEKAWRSRHQYRRDVAAFSTWLLSIARHVAIDHIRAARPHAPLDDAVTAAAATASPEDDAVRRSDTARLAELLRELPDREREVMAMKYGADLNNRAIAKATGLSESNVGTIVHRTVQMLRERW